MSFEYGKPISEELSNYLIEFTNKKDVADVATKTGLSISTIDYVRRRSNTITENNQVGIVELIKRAVKNAENSISRAKRCKQDLGKTLDCI